MPLFSCRHPRFGCRSAAVRSGGLWKKKKKNHLSGRCCRAVENLSALIMPERIRTHLLSSVFFSPRPPLSPGLSPHATPHRHIKIQTHSLSLPLLHTQSQIVSSTHHTACSSSFLRPSAASAAPPSGTPGSCALSSTWWSSQRAMGGRRGGGACALAGCLTSSAPPWPNPRARCLCPR